MTKHELKYAKIWKLLEDFPFLEEFFKQNNFHYEWSEDLSMKKFFKEHWEKLMEENAISEDSFLEQTLSYIESMKEFLCEKKAKISSLTILPWTNKTWEAEGFEKLEIKAGEVVCIVWPTWSWKSRLLADIEWIAQKDTPTSRQILLNNEIPDQSWRFSASDKLVAQLSQNMNFIMDLSVQEFLELHAESRQIKNSEEIVKKIIKQANKLAWEPFDLSTPITALSWGQSRSLMIADTAILSKSPIVLIDEIENAWVDKKKALALLLSEDKIVLMATHDPVLALMWSKRIVINNWGIIKIFEVSDKERKILSELEARDKELQKMRNKLRSWEELS